ncbi:hypothetical protein [Ornithinimicrobium pekingense]|uniref:Uncharacterized protein n=1 Tax=Ornithinimicrobium pekingense TaxID=384677 RepID=A0ABQ2FFE0_9MICO|nr:hypothetical protein [Ornithinimicrobium pekingense]GGK80448.1 hypothetical protein GCM10011509_31180 [Ornithinimicrobium pekingense]
MSFVAVVCGADPLWDVPSVTDDPVQMLNRLVEAPPAPGTDRPAADPDPGAEPPADPTPPPEATHTLFVCRPSWLPAMRRLVTLLRAHDPSRHFAVLVTDRLPLATSLVVAHVNGLGLEPGRAAREVDRLLRRTESGAWVRRPGRLNGAKVSWWDVIRSWWVKDGYVAHGAEPVVVERASADLWSARLTGAEVVYLSGEVPELPAEALRAAGVPEKLRGRDVPAGTKVLVGRQRSFEFAGPRWSAAEPAPEPEPGLRSCDSCGVSVEDWCPFCHAQWGEAPGSRGLAPQTTAQGDRG